MKGLLLILTLILGLSGTASGFCNATATKLNDTSGKVSGTNLPPNTTCLWDVEQDQVYFIITDLVLPSGDYLEIHNGDKTTANISVITGTHMENRPSVVYSWGKTVTTVILKTGPASTRDISINYDSKACAVVVSAMSGGVHGPLYLSGTNQDITCTYSISNPLSDSKLAFGYRNINITNGNVVGKEGDTDGTIVTNIKAGMTEADDAIVSMGMFLTMTFNGSSNNSISVDFMSVTPECSGSLNQDLNKTTIITSPGFPGDYDRDLYCVWVVSGTTNTTLRVDVTSFSVADQFDRLVITDGGGRYSAPLAVFKKGSDQGSFLLSSTNKLWIHFESDGGFQDHGFNLTVTPSAYGGRLENAGTIKLVNTSDPLPNQLNVTDVYYEVIADSGKQLLFTVVDLKLEPASTVEFYDGLTMDSMLLAKIDDYHLSYPVFSNGNQVLVVARSVLLNGKTQVNFTATFESVDSSSGNVVLYNSNSDSDILDITQTSQPERISWYIHAKSSESVLLSINKASLPKSSSLKVYQGLADKTAEEENNVVANWTEGVNTMSIMVKGDVRVEYKKLGANQTKAANTTVYFSAYYTKTSGCDKSVNGTGQLSSPQYPNQYPLNAMCTYNITANKAQMVYMSFSNFDLVGSHTVNVTGNKKTTVGVYTGNVLPNDTITNNSTIVTFNSRTNGVNPTVGQGFQADYEILECGGMLTKAGKVQTPNYNNANKTGFVCRWIINVPSRPTARNDSVNIINYKFTTKTDKPDSSVLEVRDGPSVRSEVVPVNLTKGTTKEVQSRYNTLWVYYKAVDKKSPGVEMEFSVYECKKSSQCHNGVCMHNAWKCNGDDDCGDGSDEAGCQYNKSTGIEGWQLALAIILTFLLTIILVVSCPYIYRKMKGNRHDEYTESLVPETI